LSRKRSRVGFAADGRLGSVVPIGVRDDACGGKQCVLEGPGAGVPSRPVRVGR